MSRDWVEDLSPEDREGWDEFVEHFRRDALEKLHQSAFVISLVPGKFDVKFAVELGAAIMMDKPILAVAAPDVQIPTRLRTVADEVVVADVDTEEGRNAIMQAISRIAE